MSLGNPLEVVVHHFLIGGMTSLGYRDGFPIMSVLVCMVTHWTGPTVSYDLRLSSSHDLTKLLYCVVSQPWENIELVLKLTMTLTYEWDCKLIIYSLWIDSLLMEARSNRYLNKGTPWYLLGLRQCVLLGDPKEVCSWKLWP